MCCTTVRVGCDDRVHWPHPLSRVCSLPAGPHCPRCAQIATAAVILASAPAAAPLRALTVDECGMKLFVALCYWDRKISLDRRLNSLKWCVAWGRDHTAFFYTQRP